MTEAQIKHMVDRFLCWRLPQPWNPDGGISYTRPNYHPDIDATPTGTNLFDAGQATQMVRHMVEGMPDTALAQAAAEVVRLRRALEKIRDVGLGLDHGSAQWQIDVARELARAALGAQP